MDYYNLPMGIRVNYVNDFLFINNIIIIPIYTIII